MVWRHVGALFKATDRSLEWRLAARVLMVTATVSAGLAALWAVVLPVAWVIDSDWTILWPVANASTAVLFVWVSWRFISQTRAYAAEPVHGRRVAWWFGAFYLAGTLWTACAVPLIGLVVPLLYAPMFLAGLAVVLVALRLMRALYRRGGANEPRP
jgi:hypothetical protein